jgi:hypothetical protein
VTVQEVRNLLNFLHGRHMSRNIKGLVLPTPLMGTIEPKGDFSATTHGGTR